MEYDDNRLTDKQKQMAENMRFYADVRFKQVTLLFAWLAIAGAGIVHSGGQYLVADWSVKQAVAACSLLITAVLWVNEIKAASFWCAHNNRMPDVWPRPPKHILSFISGTWATSGMYAVLYLAWVVLYNNWRSDSCFSALLYPFFILVGGLVVIFFCLEKEKWHEIKV